MKTSHTLLVHAKGLKKNYGSGDGLVHALLAARVAHNPAYVASF